MLHNWAPALPNLLDDASEHCSVKSVLANYESLASYFHDFSEMSNGDACSKCSGFLKQLRKFSFYSTLRLLVDVMYPMEEVNEAIQSPELSLSDVKKKIDVLLCSQSEVLPPSARSTKMWFRAHRRVPL